MWRPAGRVCIVVGRTPRQQTRSAVVAEAVEPQAYERKNQNKRDTNFPNE